jgi:transcriptional regulator with XRE-family HTH domain
MPRTAKISQDFARAFGDALKRFLDAHGVTESEAAGKLGLGKARINTYCHDSAKGKRSSPDAEVLYLACSVLGFEFEYNGYRINANTLAGIAVKPNETPLKQLSFEFDRQFYLTDDAGTVSVSIKRPSGSVEVSVSLRAVS